jgi:hypothetical protein
MYEANRDTVSKLTQYKFVYITKPSKKLECTISVGWQFIVNPFLRRDKMLVSHFSSFLFYLYISALTHWENCLARDKSIPAIPNMPWFYWKSGSCSGKLQNTHTDRLTMAIAGGNGLRGNVLQGAPLFWQWCIAIHGPLTPPNYIHFLRGLSPIEQRRRPRGCKDSCAARRPFRTASAMVSHCCDDCCWTVIRLF